MTNSAFTLSLLIEHLVILIFLADMDLLTYAYYGISLEKINKIQHKMEEIELEISGLRKDLELYQAKVRKILLNPDWDTR
ncbi:MAG: hypothetical protein ACREBA_03650 [Nitrosotalea sp.]